MKNKICIIGQGYVGSVMSIACSLNNLPIYFDEPKDLAINKIPEVCLSIL